MRILIANWSRNVSGGCEKYLQALLPGLMGGGHQVAMLYEQPFNPELESVLASERVPAWGVSEMGFEGAMRSVATWEPDVVYAHGLESGEVEQGLYLQYPTVLFAHNYYGTCGTGSKCHSFPHTRECARRFGPMCLVLHYPRRCGGLDPRNAFKVYRRQAERNLGLAHYRAILVASQHMRQEYFRHVTNQEKVRLVPLPTTDIVPQVAPPTAPASQGRILMVSRLTNVKGGDHLIEAVAKASAKLGRLTLTIAGDGPERRQLQNLAERHHVDAKFTGWVGTAEKLELMRQADLLGVPSLWPEPFGLVGIEAGCVGLPAVGFASGGIPDWLIPGYSGELAPANPPSVDSLAQAIVRALADPEHHAQLRRGSWEISKRFTMEQHLESLFSVLGNESGPVRGESAHSGLTPQAL